jgi:hypothetical protein
MATVGDVFSNLDDDVADDGYLAAQPAADHEAIAHNFGAGGDAELYFYDGADQILMATITGGGSISGVFHCTNTKYYRIKNVNGDAQHLSYDGSYSKVA